MIRLEEFTADACRLTLENLEDCQSLATALVRILSEQLPCCVGLVGTLGAGKTQLVKFLAQALGAAAEDVFSPTFVLIHPIGTSPEIYHIDAYRIGDDDEFLELGIEELFEQPAITIIEWADRFTRCMPVNTLWIEMKSQDPSSTNREIALSNLGRLTNFKARLYQVLVPNASEIKDSIR